MSENLGSDNISKDNILWNIAFKEEPEKHFCISESHWDEIVKLCKGNKRLIRKQLKEYRDRIYEGINFKPRKWNPDDIIK